MKIPKVLIILLIISVWLSGSLVAQGSLTDLEFFVDDELNAPILEAKLESDWKLLRKAKRKPKYQPAKMTFYLSDNDSVTIDLKIKPRGEFRRNHCLFPPIWLNFKSGDFENSSVSKYDKIKLVTHCRDQNSYKQMALQEYYIYKIYEILTDYSFRTRLLKINYLDSLNKREPGWNYAFFIETVEQMADRTGTTEISPKNFHPERLDREIATVMDVFQFLIGNTDWSVVVQHNIKILKSNDPKIYTPYGVPYDFDYCGLINANYAVPPEMLGIESVTERKYRGFCRTDEEFQKVFDLFTEHKDEIIGLFENSELLDKQYKAASIAFVEESLEIIGHPNLSKQHITEDCQTVQ